MRPARLAPRPVVFRRTLRASWRPDPRQVVMIVAVRREDGGTEGEVWGVEDRRVVRLEHAPNVLVEAKKRRIWVDEAVVWDGPSPGGCACQIPRALRGFRPERAHPE